jgi:CheY-like chemotaxis protein
MIPNKIKDQFKDWDVLVVDDEPDSLEVARRWLKLAGANVVTADNGQKGLDAAIEYIPRFILADLTMPVMDGWELLYELKRNPRTERIPVIALTAHALSGIREQTIRAGFVDHIPKPLSPHKFIEHVVGIVRQVPELAELLPVSEYPGSF